MKETLLPWKLVEAPMEVDGSFHLRWKWKLPFLPSIAASTTIFDGTFHELSYHTIHTHVASNVVFYSLLVKTHNAKKSCQILLLFCGRFERSGVQASCRAPNSIYQTRWPSHGCSGAGGVFSSRWRCVSVATQRKVWTPLSLSKKNFQNIVFKQARWSRRPLLVISTCVNNETFLNWISLPDRVLLTKSKLTNVFRCLRVGTLTGCPLRSSKD